MTRPVRVTVLVLLALLWLAAAWSTRDVDSDRPTSSVQVGTGEGPAWTAPHARTLPAVGPGAPGTARDAVPGARASRSHRSTGRLSVTAYCWTGHRTASGVWPRPGMAAGNRWHFGTRLYVEGVGIVTVTDRYGWGTQLDLFKASCAEARRFGRRNLRVSVIR